MSDDEVMATLRETVRQETSLTARVVALLVEVEERRLHLSRAYSNMFDFCRRYLGFSEDEAYRRKEVAKLAQKYPQLLEALAERRIHLTALLLLRDLFTPQNVDSLLAAASGKSKRDIQMLVASLAPKPDVPSLIRKYPVPRLGTGEGDSTSAVRGLPIFDASRPLPGSENLAETATATTVPETGLPTLVVTAPAAATQEFALTAGDSARMGPILPPFTLGVPELETRPTIARGEPRRILPSAQIAPLSATRHKVQFTMTTPQREKLERARALTRHGNIEGDLALVVEQALDLLIAKREREKLAAAKRPRPKMPSARPATDAGGDRKVAKADHRFASDPEAATARTAGTEATTALAALAAEKSSAKQEKPRAIAAATRREVFHRDREQCSFVGSSGERCAARELLEIDHRHPHALGGSHDASNLRVLCRAHNQFAAERIFGREHITHALANRRKRTGRADPRDPSRT